MFYLALGRDQKILEGRNLSYIYFVSSFTSDIKLSMQVIFNTFRYSIIH